MKTLRIYVKSDCPLIPHNGRLADPRNSIAKELRTYTSKRNKTESDWDRIAEIEFAGSWYWNKEKEPIIPGLNIFAAIIKGAAKARKGTAVKAGVRVSDLVLQYDGPRTVDELWKDDRFVYTTMVRLSNRRTPRTRPILEEWSGYFDVEFDPDVIDQKTLVSFIEQAGLYVGLCDYRPMYGRFVIESVEVL